jgi:uncharacterized protein (DUF1501 family)
MTDRRGFLGLGISALAGHALGADPFGNAGRLELPPWLILVELAGGNDPWNTLIPFGSDLYYRERPSLAVPPRQVLRLDNFWGLHPALGPLWPACREGRWRFQRAVVVPGADATHFRSRQAWLRFWREVTASRPPLAGGDSQGIGRESTWLAGRRPDTLLGRELCGVVDRLLSSGRPGCCGVFRGGFDLHAGAADGDGGIAGPHAELLGELAGALGALDDHLQREGLAGEVAVVVWSEMGRRLEENSWGGTEHAAGALVFSTHLAVLQLFG